MSELFLGIDVGTSSAKALLLDASGTVVASASSGYELSTPRANWSEQNPSHWWTAAVSAISDVIKKANATGSDVTSVGLTGQMHGLVLLDDAGEVLRPAILWNDQRTGQQCEEMHERIGRDRLIAITGKAALTGLTAPKILWVREHEPEVYGRSVSFLLPKDFIRYRLSGAVAIDVADASGTSLLDVTKRAWSDEIIEALGLDRSWFPEVYESPEICAKVDAEGARATGLIEGTPIVAGAGDQAAEAIGTGVIEPGTISVTMGTSGVVFAATHSPMMDPSGGMHTYCHAAPGLWHVMGVMLSAGGCLQWYRDALCADEMREAHETGADVYELITAGAESIAPGCDGLVFLPYLTGERCPHADPDARGAFVGLTRRHTRAHLTRAVMEGVAFGLADLAALARSVGVAVDSVRVSGGGSAGNLWRQILADCFNCPVARVSTTQGAAQGAAVLSAVGAGAFEDVPTACRAIVRERDVIEPGTNVGKYREMHGIYRSLYPALAATFKNLCSISE